MSDLPLTLHVPEPLPCSGKGGDCSHLYLSEAGQVRRPPVDADPRTMRDLAYELIRVLDADGRATGPWSDACTIDQLRSGLRAMLKTRAYDARMPPMPSTRPVGTAKRRRSASASNRWDLISRARSRGRIRS